MQYNVEQRQCLRESKEGKCEGKNNFSMSGDEKSEQKDEWCVKGK